MFKSLSWFIAGLLLANIANAYCEKHTLPKKIPIFWTNSISCPSHWQPWSLNRSSYYDLNYHYIHKPSVLVENINYKNVTAYVEMTCTYGAHSWVAYSTKDSHHKYVSKGVYTQKVRIPMIATMKDDIEIVYNSDGTYTLGFDTSLYQGTMNILTHQSTGGWFPKFKFRVNVGGLTETYSSDETDYLTFDDE